MRVYVCGYRCGYASDVPGFCEWCGGACKDVPSSGLTPGEAFCRLGIATREFMAHAQRQRDGVCGRIMDWIRGVAR